MMVAGRENDDSWPLAESSRELSIRFQERVSAWHVVVDRIVKTDSAILAFGERDRLPVVLKVIKQGADEWRSGEILAAFGGNGVVRVYEYVDGATLLERLNPGHSLARLALSGDDAGATRAIARTVQKMSPRSLRDSVPTVSDWGQSFDRYVTSGDGQIPHGLVSDAHEMYQALCDSQPQPQQRLLHGDLHHDNILFDADRGWLAIDPKGVIGEIEYELGAALRNPHGASTLFTDAAVIRKRLECIAGELDVDVSRVLSWAFAQAVLATIWLVEDRVGIAEANGWLGLADALRPMLNTRVI